MKLTKEQAQEIKDQQLQENKTKRVTAPELETILYEAIPVLDHGFIRVVDYMGDDSSIVQAARVSYGKGTKKVSTDAGLIKYLMRHWHSTPFEMCEIKYHVKLPIFIARQWIRHRTANVNEYSARYSILDKEFYLPAPENLATQSQNNRQGRGDVLEGDQAKKVLDLLRKDAEQTYNNYELMLNERYDGSIIDKNQTGLARELARMNLTLNTYTQWYWKIDLYNLLHFLSLRADAHAQSIESFHLLRHKLCICGRQFHGLRQQQFLRHGFMSFHLLQQLLVQHSLVCRVLVHQYHPAVGFQHDVELAHHAEDAQGHLEQWRAGVSSGGRLRAEG